MDLEEECCATSSSWQSPNIPLFFALRSSGMILMVDFGVVMEKKRVVEMLQPRRRGSAAFRLSLRLWLQSLVIRLLQISIRRFGYDLSSCVG